MISELKKYARYFFGYLGLQIERTPSISIRIGRVQGFAVLPPDKITKIDFDFVMRDFLMRIEKPEDVVFVEVGAYDGKKRDELHKYIDKYDWRGVLVEPQPSVFADLEKTYENNDNVSLLNCAVGKREDYETIYTTENSTEVASFDKNHLLKHGIEIDKIYEEKVRVKTLMEIIEQKDLLDVNVIQVDAEGYDSEIIRMIELDKISPNIIYFEDEHLSYSEHLYAVEMLVDNGYKVAPCGGDTIAYRRN